MTPETLTPEKAAERIWDNIFNSRRPYPKHPDMYDAANLIAGITHDILGYREVYKKLKEMVDWQQSRWQINSPQMVLMRQIEGLDELNRLEQIVNSSTT